MSVDQHDVVNELLASYALDAVEPQERAMVEQHLATCTSCRKELDEYCTTAAQLGALPGAPPADLWSRIDGVIGGSPPPIRLEVAHRRRSWRMAWVSGAAAAVLLVVGVVAGTQLFNEAKPAESNQIAADALKRPGAKMVALTSESGSMMAKVVVMTDGYGYVLEENLPQLPTDRTYQLWAVTKNEGVISAGVWGADPEGASFRVTGDTMALALTEEAAGGVTESQSAPVVTGVLPA